MKYEVKKEVVNEAELTITVDTETVGKAVNKAYLKVAKDVNIPGFRKGKYRNSFWNRESVKPRF